MEPRNGRVFSIIGYCQPRLIGRGLHVGRNTHHQARSRSRSTGVGDTIFAADRLSSQTVELGNREGCQLGKVHHEVSIGGDLDDRGFNRISCDSAGYHVAISICFAQDERVNGIAVQRGAELLYVGGLCEGVGQRQISNGVGHRDWTVSGTY